MLNLNFEIMLTCDDGMFIAHCGNFPECQGYGATETEALSDLADAISCRMTETIRGAITDFVKSGVLDAALRDIEKIRTQQQPASPFSIETQPTSMGGFTRKIHFSGQLPEANMAKLKKSSEGVKKYSSIFARYLPGHMGLGVGYGLGMPMAMPELPMLGDIADPLSGFMISLN